MPAPMEEQLRYKREFEAALKRLKKEHDIATAVYQEAVAKAFREFVSKCGTIEEEEINF